MGHTSQPETAMREDIVIPAEGTRDDHDGGREALGAQTMDMALPPSPLLLYLFALELFTLL
eukprot:6690151-Prorocentrum_lima.AAC.1